MGRMCTTFEYFTIFEINIKSTCIRFEVIFVGRVSLG
jgi:hypothetical protein